MRTKVVSGIACGLWFGAALIACSSTIKPLQGTPSKKCNAGCGAKAKRDAGVRVAAAGTVEAGDAGDTAGKGMGTFVGGGDAGVMQSGVCTSDGDCEEHLAVGSPVHVDGPIDYPDPPPVGGMHNPCWTTYGVHDQPVAAENWVHNLEHGGIVFLYQCACADERAQLETFVKAHKRAVLTEYGNMKKRFAVVAWGCRLQTDTLDMPAFEAFYAEHFDHGLESIDGDPPASCGM